MRGSFNLCLAERRVYICPLDELAELQSVHRGLAKERDIDLAETRRIDSGHEDVQILASPSIFEVSESGENDAFPWRWRQAEVALAAEAGK